MEQIKNKINGLGDILSTPRNKAKIRNISVALMRAVFIIGFCFVILYPMINMASRAFMHKDDLFDPSVIWVPKTFTLDNIRLVATVTHYTEALLNTLRITFMTTVLQTISCMFIGYGFARFNFRFKNILFALVIFTLIVPPQTIMVPMYLHFRAFDVAGIIEMTRGEPIRLLDTSWPFAMLSLTGMGIRNGLFIFIFRQFFRGIPNELEEAGLIDGAGYLAIFRKIMVPISITPMITVSLFSLVWQWNDSFYSSLFLTNMRVLALSVNVIGFTSDIEGLSTHDVNNPYFMALLSSSGVFLFVVPLIIIYIFAQRYFVESIERSGIVG